MNEVFIDLSEMAARPLRTGIQRVERELLRNWPGPAPLVPCAFDCVTGTLGRLPESLLDRLLRADPESCAAVSGTALPIGKGLAGRIIFNPELFFDRARASFYRALCRAGAQRVSWLLYDFLPWLHPELFGRSGAPGRMDFLRTVWEVPRVAFISEDTRTNYHRAIMRGGARDGPVFALGGDGLGLPHQKFDPSRRDFVVLGTIEPRKSVDAILEAFQSLWAEGVSAHLVLLGRISANADREQAMLAALADAPLLRFIEQPDDATVCRIVSRARALVTASTAEGFGLAPVEALAAGIAVITPENLPSIQMLPRNGQIRLARLDPPAIAAAVRRLLDNNMAARLFAEAASLHVHSWKDFAESIAAWLQDP